jgi:GntP family gluconate:H+ symporter
VHGLVPPHPGPLLAIGVFGADIGKTILYGLIVALPTAIIAGPIFGTFIAKHIPGTPNQELVDQLARETDSQNLPSFSITLVTVLLPVFLMLLKTFADVALPDGHFFRTWMDMIGHPISALLLALLLSLYTFGHKQGIGSQQMLKWLDAEPGADRRDHADHRCRWWLQADAGDQRRGRRDRPHGGQRADLADPAGMAGGGGDSYRHRFGHRGDHHGAGIVVPVVGMIPGVNRELLVLATGAGSLILSHVNDAGFWLVKQYFNMTVAETFKTWTAMETILSVVGLGFILLLSLFV